MKNDEIVLYDAFVGSGNRARMALQVLLDHRYQQSKITFVCLLTSRNGIAYLANLFPEVKFVTCSILDKLDNEHWTQQSTIGTIIKEYCQHSDLQKTKQRKEKKILINSFIFIEYFL